MCRALWRRESPLSNEGEFYVLPLSPERGTGLGKALTISPIPCEVRYPSGLRHLAKET